MDLGRIHLIALTGILKPALKRRWLPVLASAKVHFIRSLNVFQKLTMTTQVIYWDEKWIYLEQKIFVKEVLCVTALFKTVFTSKSGKISPEKILALIPQLPLQRPTMPKHLEAWLEAEKASKE
jgi:acyl-CoA thioesterase FadM